MNGFSDHGLDEDAFGEKKGNLVQAFDAFRKFSHSLSFTILIPMTWTFYSETFARRKEKEIGRITS